MKNEKTKIKTSIGGQALIEGIMMRGPKKTAMAVRRPDGGIELEVTPTVSTGAKIKKIPVIRGVFAFADSMISGYKSLMRSAEIAMPEISEASEKSEDGEAAAAGADTAGEVQPAEAAVTAEAEAAQRSAEAAAIGKDSKDKKGKDKKGKTEKKEKSEEITPGEMTAVMIIGVILGFGLAIVLFKLLPEAIYQLLVKLFPGMDGEGYGYSLLRAAITGIIKIAILVAYMAAVSLMKDIRRTFEYHGAEHKTIFCYEKGLDLTVENVRKQIRFHPRCGTSFIVLSVLVSIFVTMFIPTHLVENNILNTLARTGIGLLLLPVTMGLGYELIRLAGRHDNAVTRIISKPGVWLQHITTREPDDTMIECAIAAVKEVIPEDGSDRI